MLYGRLYIKWIITNLTTYSLKNKKLNWVFTHSLTMYTLVILTLHSYTLHKLHTSFWYWWFYTYTRVKGPGYVIHYIHLHLHHVCLPSTYRMNYSVCSRYAGTSPFESLWYHIVLLAEVKIFRLGIFLHYIWWKDRDSERYYEQGTIY